MKQYLTSREVSHFRSKDTFYSCN